MTLPHVEVFYPSWMLHLDFLKFLEFFWNFFLVLKIDKSIFFIIFKNPKTKAMSFQLLSSICAVLVRSSGPRTFPKAPSEIQSRKIAFFQQHELMIGAFLYLQHCTEMDSCIPTDVSRRSKVSSSSNRHGNHLFFHAPWSFRGQIEATEYTYDMQDLLEIKIFLKSFHISTASRK